MFRTTPIRLANRSKIIRSLIMEGNSFNFPVQPIGRFAGASRPVKRPKEFACFSYDENHELHLDDSSLKYYYTPTLGASLSQGLETFQKQDDSADEHLDSLLTTIMNHEKKEGQRIDADVVTWRGMMSKIMAAPFEKLDGFSMNATMFESCLYIEENNKYKIQCRNEPRRANKGGGPPMEEMTYWGYKFETLSTLPSTWSECSREFIENRENQIVNNKAQYCSIVRTGIGNTTLCLGGEVDAIWDSKPKEPGAPINWVELKTSAEINHEGQMANFHRKLMKYWIQSFLLGVPKIMVGFRTPSGILTRVDEIETQSIPATVNARPNPAWNADMCVNFTAEFLEWLMKTIADDGVWRITRKQNSQLIEVYRVEDQGHGEIITPEFLEWRTQLMRMEIKARQQEIQQQEALEQQASQ